MFTSKDNGMKSTLYEERVKLFAQKVEYIVDKGYELEREGRDIASERTGVIGDRDEKWFESLCDYHGEISDFMRVAEYFVTSKFTYEDASALEEDACKLYYSVLELYDLIKGKPRSIHFLNPSEVSREVIDIGKDVAIYLKNYDETVSYCTGKSGLWLWGKIPPEKYSWAALVNDVSAVFHGFVNYLAEVLGEFTKVSPRVYVHPKANPHAIELALKWEKAVDVLYDKELISSDDYDALAAIVIPGEMQFRVGSAEGHMTHIILAPLGYEVEYYDRDDNVRLVLSRIAVDYGCRIMEDVEGGYTVLFCPSLTGAADNFVKYVLPFATSMDFRLDNSAEYWQEIIPGYNKKFKGMNPLDIEYHACKWFIENVLKRELG